MFKNADIFLQKESTTTFFHDTIKKLTLRLDFYHQKLIDQYQNRYPILIETFEDAKNDILKLIGQYGETYTPQSGLSDTSTLIEMEQTKPTRPKIKWLANTNVLVTLFYDLLNGQERAGPLIEADKNALKDFLINNFLDSDGNTLSESTIATLFTPSKIDKRSKIGDRIEISNVKQKK
jgi:hypothetical protein